MAIKTITLKGTGMRKELTVGSVITPGHLVERSSGNQGVVHPTSGGNAQKIFAVEDDIQGNGIDDDYASGEQGQFDWYRAGDEVYAWAQGLGTAIVIGSALMSAGDGTLILHVAPDLEVSGAAPDLALNQIVAYALEAVDLSASGSDDARIQIEIA